MPTFEIGLDDGRSLHIDADSQDAALTGAQHFLAANPAQPSAGESVGGATSVLSGFPILGGLVPQGAAALRSALPGLTAGGAGTYDQELAKVNAAKQQFEQNHGGLATAGQFVAGTAPFAGAAGVPALARGLGLAGDTLTGMATRGALSGAAIGGADAAVRGADPMTGAAVGFGTGAVAPALGRAVGAILSPGAGMSAERQAAASALAKEGIQPTAGQVTGNKKIQYMESELGGAKQASALENAQEQFSAAALRRAGIAEARATPEVLSNAFDKNGAGFEAVAARNPEIKLPSDFGQALSDATTDLANHKAPSALMRKLEEISQGAQPELPAAGSTISRQDYQRLAAGTTGPAVISGAQYQSLSSEIARAMRSTANPDLKMALYDFRAALDKAVQNGLAPQDALAWQQLRQQYKNLLVIERAVSGSGEAAAKGLITPTQLTNAIKAVETRKGYTRGNSAFADLARAGNQVLTSVPQSGTAPRAAARAIPAMLGGMIGGVGLHALPGAALGAAAPWALGRALMSRPGQAYLTNQVANPEAISGLLGLLGKGSQGLLDQPR